MNLVFDIETDDIKATKVWCIVAQDIETKKVYKFRPDDLEKGLKLLAQADKLIGHNIIGFDLPVLKKLLNFDYEGKVVDTLVLSRLFNPVREGGHSLEVWGQTLGINKIEFEQFDSFSEEMLDYCVQDVKVNTRIYSNLVRLSKEFSKESMRLEHDVAPIIKEQELNGFKFDSVASEILLASLRERVEAIEREVKKVFLPRMLDVKFIIPTMKKDGTLSKRGLRQDEYDRIIKTNNYEPFYRKELQEFNLGSRKQIGEYLVDFGWKPKKFTPTGQPIVDEITLYEIDNIPEAKLIAEFLLIQKRVAQIQSWVDSVEEDGRVHGFVIPNGTITGRMTHRKPNMAQVPSIYSPYGKECRACWTTEEGYKLVGIDASQLELRLLAHYMNDENYIKNVTTGDIHETNRKLAGLNTRDEAKTFIYAFIYGAGDKKIGSVVGGDTKDGERLRNSFLNNIPSLRKLRTKVSRVSSKGWITGLDGRKLFIRTQHGALNTLLQGAGAIFMKKALVLLNKWANCSKLDFKFVANIHDEWQVEVKEEQADFFGEMAVKSMVEAGKLLDLRCDMNGEYKVGDNWSETH